MLDNMNMKQTCSQQLTFLLFTVYTETIPQKVIVGDITKLAEVCEAVKGVDYVIHTCGYVSVKTFPDATGMKKVNVDGTQNN